MKFSPKVFLLILVGALLLVSPSLVLAHDASLFPFGYWGPFLSCTGDYLGGGEACTSVCDVFHTLQHIIYFGLSLVVFALAPVMFLAGGIMVVLGGANPAIISRGRSILWGTLIGVVIALGSFIIIATFLWVVGNDPAEGVAWPQIRCNPATVPGYQVNPDLFRTGFDPAYGPDFTATSTSLGGYGCDVVINGQTQRFCSSGSSQNCSGIPQCAGQVCKRIYACATTGDTGSKCNNGTGCGAGNQVCVWERTDSSGRHYACKSASSACNPGCGSEEACVKDLIGPAYCADTDQEGTSAPAEISPAPTGTSPSVSGSNCNSGQGCGENVCVRSGNMYFCQQRADGCRGAGGRLGCPLGSVCISGAGGSACATAGD